MDTVDEIDGDMVEQRSTKGMRIQQGSYLLLK